MFIALLLLSSSFVLADIPITPHGFYGNVYYADGNLILESLEIRAEFGDYENTFVLTGGAYDLVVQSENYEGKVYFYLEGLTDSIGSYDFLSFEITELDFTTTLVNPNPDSGGSPGGNGDSPGGGSPSGGSPSSSTTPNDEGIIVLDEQEDEEEEVVDEPEVVDEQTVGTGTGAVVGFIKSAKGIGLGIGLMFLIAGSVVFLTQKKKSSLK